MKGGHLARLYDAKNLRAEALPDRLESNLGQ